MNQYMNFWHLLNKRQPPIGINGEFPFEPGTCQFTFVFHNGEIALTFTWEAEIVKGQKSTNPYLVPDDPDMIICTGISVTEVLSYDKDGNEKPIKVSTALNMEFTKWIKSTNYLQCNDFGL